MLEQYVRNYPVVTALGRAQVAAALRSEPDQSAYVVLTYLSRYTVLASAFHYQKPVQESDATAFERISGITECLLATRDSSDTADADNWAGFLKFFPQPRRIEFLRAVKAQDTESWAIMGIDKECGLVMKQAKDSGDVPDRCFGK